MRDPHRRRVVPALVSTALIAVPFLHAPSGSGSGSGSGPGSERPRAAAPPRVQPAAPAPPHAREAPAKSAAQDRALAAYRRMTPAQRVGQLFVLGETTTDVTHHDLRQIDRLRIGGVTLLGDSDRGLDATTRTVNRLRRAATDARVAPLVATDQEGGEVQELTGPGFDAMPTALEQGRLGHHTLRADASRWGGQLHAAGLNTDLAPVCDVVPRRHAHDNQPIGRYDREYGHGPRRVTGATRAFAAGMTAAGILPTLKHFPGLGRATGNTDVTAGVTDPTTRHDPYLTPFERGIAAGVPLVMVSTATYPHIDASHRAAFSHRIMHGMLRHDMGFTGAIVSDSLSTVAMQDVPVAARAKRFVAAGGDLAIVTARDQIEPMVSGVLAAAGRSHAFAHDVRHAVLTVLTVKAQAGLVHS